MFHMLMFSKKLGINVALIDVSLLSFLHKISEIEKIVR